VSDEDTLKASEVRALIAQTEIMIELGKTGLVRLDPAANCGQHLLLNKLRRVLTTLVD
jgi:hypothetical protein